MRNSFATQIGIPPTNFEEDLARRFQIYKRDFGNNQECSALLVCVPKDTTYASYDREFLLTENPQDPHKAIKILNEQGRKVVIALDLRDSFENQWPLEYVGFISHPGALLETPLITIPTFKTTQDLVSLNAYRRVLG